MQTKNSNLFLYLAGGSLAMALVVYVSNVLVMIPIQWLNPNWFNYAQFTFPLAFLVTDVVNRLLGSKRAYQVIAVGFVVGGLMSIIGGDVRIGLASITAFAIGQTLDVKVFNRLRSMAWWLAPLISSLLASLVDTTWFYTVAFYGADWPWQQQAIVDFGIKMLVAVCALLPFKLLIARSFSNEQTV